MAATTTTAIFKLLLLLVACVKGSVGQECTADGDLCDKHERCAVWKEEGECIREKRYMNKHCPASCADAFREYSSVDDGEEECFDSHEHCPLWAQIGECKTNASNMRKYCPKACKLCGDDDEEEEGCVDTEPKCPQWAEMGECEANPNYMTKYCPLSCGTCPDDDDEDDEDDEDDDEEADDEEDEDALLEATTAFGVKQEARGNEKLKTLEVIRASIDYMENEIDNLPTKIVDQCLNRKDLCAFWAVVGECEKNEAYMLVHCAPSCKSCHLIDMESRCPPLNDPKPALKPGDLNKMFQRVVDTAPGNRTLSDEERQELQSQGMTEYSVHVVSRPQTSSWDTISRDLDKENPPWVVVLDNFTTETECQRMIDLGHEQGYERSKDVGNKQKFDGSFDAVESKGRTSENAWCSEKSGCRDDPVVQNVMNRIAQVLDIDAKNSEDLQLLKYEVSQFYNSHHDYIQHQRDRQCGPRILTVFMYLNEVSAGGGTRFNNLDITVTPKVGRVLIWPSVYNSDPMTKDPRMMHEALPVEAGIKFGSNGWIHMYDYLGPQSRGCN